MRWNDWLTEFHVAALAKEALHLGGQGLCSCTILRPWVGSLDAALVIGLYTREHFLVNLDNFKNGRYDFSIFLHAGLNQRNFALVKMSIEIFLLPKSRKDGFFAQKF